MGDQKKSEIFDYYDRYFLKDFKNVIFYLKNINFSLNKLIEV